MGQWIEGSIRRVICSDERAKWKFLAKEQRRSGSILPVKTTCTHCGARYVLPDKKAAPSAQIRCRSCGGVFSATPAEATYGKLERGDRATRARPGPTRSSSDTGRGEESALFSLAALAREAGEQPAVESSLGEGSDLIDLKQMLSEPADATVTPVPTAVPLLPLGVDPLGVVAPDAPAKGSPAFTRRGGMTPSMLLGGSVAIALVIVATAFATRSRGVPGAAEVAPAAVSSVVTTHSPTLEAVASASAAVAEASSSAAAAPSASGSVAADDPVVHPPPRPPPPRPPRPPPTQDDDVRPNPPPPSPPPANPCAHCGNDLACSIACRVQ